MQVRQQLGNTAYYVEDAGPGMAKVTRSNAEGVTVIHLPLDILVDFVGDKMGEAVVRMLKRATNDS